MMNKQINEQQLKCICDVLGDTSDGFTKSELSELIMQCNIKLADDQSFNNGQVYKFGLSKSKWLYNSLAGAINNSGSFKKVYEFIENALNPIRFTNENNRSKYDYLYEEMNKVLLLIGLQISKKGIIEEVIKAKTLDEVDRRVNSLNKKLYDRSIHPEVKKYCKEDYLRKDYSDAVFEAAKELAQRVREITGLELDGGTLFQTAFSTKKPYIFFNKLETQNEINEFIGLKELLQSIFHLIRNPAAHTPKINWRIDESKALDVLTLVSFSHKYLYECNKVPRYY